MADRARIGIIGDYDPVDHSHPETNSAIEASAARLGISAVYEWVATDAVERSGANILDEYDGIWVSPGGPYRSLEGALAGIRHVRESERPLVGT